MRQPTEHTENRRSPWTSLSLRVSGRIEGRDYLIRREIAVLHDDIKSAMLPEMDVVDGTSLILETECQDTLVWVNAIRARDRF